MKLFRDQIIFFSINPFYVLLCFNCKNKDNIDTSSVGK